MPKNELNIVMKEGDILKKKDFEGNFRKVIDIILKMQRENSAAIVGLKELYENLLARVKKEHGTSLEDLKKGVNSLFVEGKLKEMDDTTRKDFGSLKGQINSIMDDKLRDIEKKALAKALPGGKGDPGDQGRTLSSGEIQLAITPMINKILKDWKERLAKLNSPRRGLGGASRIYKRLTEQPFEETPNGSRTDFTITKRSFLVESLAVYQNTDRVMRGESADYTVAGQTVTFALAPQEGDVLFADFEHY